MRKRHLGFVILPEGEPPSEFRIWGYGEVRCQWEGEPVTVFQFTPEDAQEVVRRAANSQTRGELHIDYQHRTDLPVDNSPAVAAGWFNLEAREDGLYAVNVRWTPRAAQMLIDREFRYHSPVFWDEKGHIRQLDKLSLTNEPATIDQAPLMASASAGSGGSMNREKLIALLGLPSDATDEQIESALNAMREQAGQAQAAQALLASAGITARIGTDEARGQAMALAANAQLASRVAQLERENAELKAGRTAQDAEAVVEQALQQGKILAHQRAFWLDKAKADLAGVKAYFASAAPVVPTAPVKPEGDHAPADHLTAEELEVIRQLQITKEQYLAWRKKGAA